MLVRYYALAVCALAIAALLGVGLVLIMRTGPSPCPDVFRTHAVVIYNYPDPLTEEEGDWLVAECGFQSLGERP
ncbi:hypothetical protein LCGC14_0896590 [marine sediment metagenome]|uniref:Uncharacterized protein n=1 Tax=marine sediment metagenome TaxID=412755 RepID=A0A0F9RGV6_9ZZZZ